MRYLQFGLVGEGSTDHEYFCVLVTRVVENLVLLESELTVQAGEALSIRPGGAYGNAPKAAASWVMEQYEYLDLLFYHADAAGDVDAANRTRVEVARGMVSMPLVGVVPKREMEAWILADPAAVASALGVGVNELDVRPEHRPKRVESILDPKLELQKLMASAPVRRRRSVGRDDLMRRFGERTSLKALERVPQGRALIEDTRRALVSLGVIA